MILKTAGAILILISSCLIGKIITNESTKRLKELNVIRLFLVRMKELAKDGELNIADCIEVSVEKFDFKTKGRFVEFLRRIKYDNYTDFEDAWKSTNTDMKPLAEKDEIIFGNFVKLIDGHDINSFVSAIESAIEDISKIINELTNDEKKNRKLYYNLCICAGIFTVILLI